MSEYIDKAKLCEEISKITDELRGGCLKTPASTGLFRSDLARFTEVLSIKHMIEEFKTEDVAPVVHGKWCFAEDSVFRCSVCGRICYEDGAPYCYCGAKMDLEEDA